MGKSHPAPIENLGKLRQNSCKKSEKCGASSDGGEEGAALAKTSRAEILELP
jgi:hypothetical protein